MGYIQWLKMKSINIVLKDTLQTLVNYQLYIFSQKLINPTVPSQPILIFELRTTVFLVQSRWLLSPIMYKFYFVAPVTCTDGGGECAGNADGLISCPAGGGNCIGKSFNLYKTN